MSLTVRLFSASASIAIAGIIAKSLSIITAPLLTSLLGPESYGVMALLTTLIALGATLAMLGSDLAYLRFACSGSPNEDFKVEVFCWQFILCNSCFISLFVIFISVMKFFNWFSSINLPSEMLIVAGLGVTFTVFDTMAQTRQRMYGKYTKLALTSVISAITSSLITILLAFYWRRDAWPMLLGFISGPILSVAILGVPSISRLMVSSGLSSEKIKELLHFGFTGSAVSAPLYWIVSTSDRWFINAYANHKDVGIYAFSCSIAYMGQMLNNAVLVAWRTESFKSFETSPQNAPRDLGELWSQLIVVFGLVWLCITAMGGDVIRLLATADFFEGTAYVPWLAGAVFFYGVAQMASTGLLLGKKMKPWTYWWLFAGVCSIGLNLLFVRLYGALGAAIVQLLSFAIISVGVMYTAQKVYPLIINFKKLLLITPIVIISGVIMSYSWSHTPLISLCYKSPAILLVSIAAMYCIAPQLLKQLAMKVIPPRNHDAQQ